VGKGFFGGADSAKSYELFKLAHDILTKKFRRFAANKLAIRASPQSAL